MTRIAGHTRRRGAAILAFLLLSAVIVVSQPPQRAVALADTASPVTPQKLVFVHHSTGEAWLADGYGGLGTALRARNYFVSDTNYGWGPTVSGGDWSGDAIGSHTDIGHWWTWFRGPDSSAIASALYANSAQWCGYSRLGTDPGGPNTIVMLKSCFPNANVDGSPSDPVPTIADNPLKGSSAPLTVGNAKGIYLDLLDYFAAHPDTMFVLVVSPPRRAADTDSAQAANARYLADWLVASDGWLRDYTAGNVVAWDYYTVITGGHHRISGGVVEHTAGPSNYLAYPTDDSHPSAEGDQRATAEFAPFLNAAYNSWKAGTGANLRPVAARHAWMSAPSAGSTGLSKTRSYRWSGRLSPAQIGSGTIVLSIQHASGGRWKTWGSRSIAIGPGATGWAAGVRLSHAGRYRLRTYHADADHARCYSAFREVTVR